MLPTRSIPCQSMNDQSIMDPVNKSSPINSGHHNRETSDFNGPILSYVWRRSYMSLGYYLPFSQLGAQYSSHDLMLIRQSITIEPIHESHIDSYQFISSIKSILSTNQLSNPSQSFVYE